MRLALGAAVFLVLASTLFVAGLSFSGFCFEERRYLTDEEKINIAVLHVLRFYPPIMRKEIVAEGDERKEILTGGRPKAPIPYRDLKEFREVNPNCCRVVMQANHSGGEVGDVAFWQRLFGLTSCFVEVKYLVRYRDATGMVHFYTTETFPAISNCGYLWSGI
jgi:hypothetical protein